MPKKMRLWTIHQNDAFSLTDGRVDHSKSEYYMGFPGVREAYPKLWRCLGVPDGQIVWCYTRREDIPITGTPKQMWELEVPESSILAYIDDVIWNRILKIRVLLTPRYTKAIREKANKKFPDDPQSRRHYEKELEKKFWDDELPESALWNQLRLDGPVDGSSALIKHPVRKDWIIECRTLCCRKVMGSHLELDSAEKPRFVEIVCRSSEVCRRRPRLRGEEAGQKSGRP